MSTLSTIFDEDESYYDNWSHPDLPKWKAEQSVIKANKELNDTPDDTLESVE